MTEFVFQLSLGLDPWGKREPEDQDVNIILFQTPGTETPVAFWKSWKMSSSENCWLEELLSELSYGGGGKQVKARVLATYYGSSDLEQEDITRIMYPRTESAAHDILSELRKNVPVFLVGHDLGGALMKRIVLEAENQLGRSSEDRYEREHKFMTNLKSVHLFEPPLFGDGNLSAVECAPTDDRYLPFLRRDKDSGVEHNFRRLLSEYDLNISSYNLDRTGTGRDTDMMSLAEEIRTAVLGKRKARDEAATSSIQTSSSSC
ncbi:hypothetical protein R1sor_015275 [Riccia sorocarpa]|uniref:AB hydrolase-1 domain-containing protein n=1 Tax=Riccia sorocarpa TaxID=122646 RepID=A0ABD3HDL9_9MARC